MHISEQKKKEAMALRAQIYRYLKDNLGIKQTQVADKFEISRSCASVHVRAISAGWKPEGESDVS